MKKAIALFIAMILTLTLCACGGNSEDNSPAYIGTWKINQILGSSTNEEETQGILIIKTDGTFTWQLLNEELGTDSTLSGTYAVNEEETAIQFSGDCITNVKNNKSSSSNLEKPMKLKGDILDAVTMKVTAGSGNEVVELKKQ